MIVDFEEKEVAGWFDLGDGARAKFRLLQPSDFKAMREACVKGVVEYPRLEDENGILQYRRFTGTNFDEALWNEMLWDRTIVEWEGILDRNGAEVPVTKENKVLLMERVAAFGEARNKAVEALKAGIEEKAEQSEKNLSAG